MPTPQSPPAAFAARRGADHEPDLLVIDIVPAIDDDRPAIEEMVALARAERQLRRFDLRQRYAVIAIDLERPRWFSQPWARIGVAALLGFAIGRSKTVRALVSLSFGAALVMAVNRAFTPTTPVDARW